MKYIDSILKLSKMLSSAVLTVICFAGCADWDDQNNNPGEVTGESIKFTLTVPNMRIPEISTRTMAGTGLGNKENEIQSVDVLVFDASVSPAVFTQWIEGTNISQDLNSSSTAVDFTAALSTTSGSTQIVIIANNPLSSIADDFKKNEMAKTKAEILEMLTVSLSGNEKWPANGSIASGYRPIPMYGEITVTKIDRNREIPPIEMTRMLARIDLLTSAENFTVEEVYLANYNAAGYIAPAWEPDNGVDGLKIPSDVKQVGETNMITYPVNGSKSYIGEIYTFEAQAAADGSDDTADSRKNAVCLIVKGKIESGGSSYYRVDFLKADPPHPVAYMPLKRNNKYIIDIQQANGVGYSSIQDALNSYRTMTHLDVRLISNGGNEKIRSVVYNGQYMLGVSELEIKFREHSESAYTVNVYTDTPGGWAAKIPSDSWLKFTDDKSTASGSPNGDSGFSLQIPYYSAEIGSSRSETIRITAGRLTHDITITQTVEEPGMIKLMDAYGYELADGLFFPMDYIEPQTVYVMWSSPKLEAHLHSRASFEGGTPVSYESLSPADLGGTGPENPVTWRSNVQAITLKPEGGFEDWRWDIIHLNIFDNKGDNVGGIECHINQGRLDFRINNCPLLIGGAEKTYALELGPEQTIELYSNVNWQIVGVEEIDNTGLVLDNERQQIKPGISNEIIGIGKPIGVGTDKDIIKGADSLYLTFPTGEWEKGKTGTVRVTFRNEMHTAGSDNVANNEDDKRFPFQRIINLKLTAIEPLEASTYFYVYPIRYTWDDGGTIKSSYFSLANAKKECEKLGKGWRMPTLSEGLMASVYADALGGLGVDVPNGWFTEQYQNRYWTSAKNTSSGEYLGVLVGYKGGADKIKIEDLEDFSASVRCVRDVSEQGTKYPYIQSYSSGSDVGVLIVSQDNNGGIPDSNSSIFFGSSEIPDESEAKNKVAKKLLVANENSNLPNTGTFADAKSACIAKGSGWRLPTQREVVLMMSVGMVQPQATYNNDGFGDRFPLPGNFVKINPASNPIWVLTQKNDNEAYMLFDKECEECPLLDYTFSGRNKTGEWWVLSRCVKTIN